MTAGAAAPTTAGAAAPTTDAGGTAHLHATCAFLIGTAPPPAVTGDADVTALTTSHYRCGSRLMCGSLSLCNSSSARVL